MESPRLAGSRSILPSNLFVLPSKLSMDALETNTTLFSFPGWTRNSSAPAGLGRPARSPRVRSNRIRYLGTHHSPPGLVQKMELQHGLQQVAPRIVHAVVELGAAQERFQGHVGARHDEDAASPARLGAGAAVPVGVEEVVGPDHLESLSHEIRDLMGSHESHRRSRPGEVVLEEIRLAEPGHLLPGEVSVGTPRVIVHQVARVMVPRNPQ